MSWLLSNPDRPYLDSSKTDVMKTWKKHGFVPPSETKESKTYALEDVHEMQHQQTPLSIQSTQRG
jgi:hypothetical protein